MKAKRDFWILLTGLLLVGMGTATVIRLKPVEKIDSMPESSSRQLRRWQEQLARFIAERRYKDCELLLRRILKVDPNSVPMRRMLGKVLYETDSVSEAEDIFRELVLCHPQDAVSRNNFGMTLCARQRYEAGLRELYHAFRISRGSRLIGINLAGIYRRQQNPAAALAVFKEAKNPPPDAFPSGIPPDAITIPMQEQVALEQMKNE